MSEQPRLWDSLLEQAQSGQLTVDLDGDTFDAIDRAFESFMRELIAVQVEVHEFGVRPGWGLAAAGEQLASARDTITHLQLKALEGDNSADRMLTEYLQVAERVRAMFQAMRRSYTDTENYVVQGINDAGRPR